MASLSPTKSILKPKSNLGAERKVGVGELIKSVSFDSNIESTRSSNFKATAIRRSGTKRKTRMAMVSPWTLKISKPDLQSAFISYIR